MTVSPARRALLWAVFLGLVVGCGEEPIRSYEVPKPPAEKEPEKPTEVRLLGAIIPTGDKQSRFVKFTGPADKIDSSSDLVRLEPSGAQAEFEASANPQPAQVRGTAQTGGAGGG